MAQSPILHRSTQSPMLRRRGACSNSSRSSGNSSSRASQRVLSLMLPVVLVLFGGGSVESAAHVGPEARAGAGAHRYLGSFAVPGVAALTETVPAAGGYKRREEARGRRRRSRGHKTCLAFVSKEGKDDGDRLHMPRIGGIRRPDWLGGGGGVDGHLVRDFKMALAGALAGAIATAALFPIDTAKTLRQANPKAFKGTRDALSHICRTRGPWAIYNGIPTAVLGAMPSSALYFGTYEAVKTRLMRAAADECPEAPASGDGDGDGGAEGGGVTEGVHPAARAGAHAVAAACGNAASSLVFVPKEYVKQTLQASGMGAAGGARETAKQVVRRTLREKGVQGLYRGYWATLSRNVPSAIIRFSLYEEIKLFIGPTRLMSAPPAFLLAGALAGACASGMTTPFDVLKTRVATGSLDGGRGFVKNMASIVADDGWKGLYAGFQPRVVMSGLFTAVGFGSFEALKAALGVSPLPLTANDEGLATASASASERTIRRR